MAQDMSKFIIGIVIIGITLCIGIFISATLEYNFSAPGTTGSYANESVTRTTTLSTLVASNLLDGQCGAATKILNGSSGVVNIVIAGNFTQSGCTLTNVTDMEGYGSTIRVSYPFTYTAGTASSNAAGSLVTSLAGGSAWITILVVVGFAVIVLGMLSSGLGRAAGGGIGYGEAEPTYTY